MACTTHHESIQADSNWVTVRKHCWCLCVWGLGLCKPRMDQVGLLVHTFSKRLLPSLNWPVFTFNSLAKQGDARQDGKNYLENSLAQDPSQRTWWENEIWTVEDYINGGTYNHLNSFMIAVMQEVYNTLVKTILFFIPPLPTPSYLPTQPCTNFLEKGRRPSKFNFLK